jgi:hypothetical protein
MNRLFSTLMLSWTAISASGCMVDVDHPGHYYDAVFTVEWSVDGTTDPAECARSGARYAYVRVESRYGVEDEHEVPCEDFGTAFTLPPGRYWVHAVLLDRRHAERTESVETDSQYVDDGDYVVIDFPADSFL